VNDVVPFTFEGTPVRVLVVDEEPWWIARDVCAVLDIQNNRDALSSLDDDEKGVATTDTLGGPQQLATVNEPGLYSLIFRSRKPEAKAFKRWVTHEVLPQIRRTGRYDTARPDLAEITARNDALIAQYKAGVISHADAVRRAKAIRVELGETPDPPARTARPRGGDPVDRVAELLLHHLEADGGWIPRRRLRGRLHGDRRPLFDTAAARLETAGLLHTKPVCHGTPGTAYRAATTR